MHTYNMRNTCDRYVYVFQCTVTYISYRDVSIYRCGTCVITTFFLPRVDGSICNLLAKRILFKFSRFPPSLPLNERKRYTSVYNEVTSSDERTTL